MAELPNPQEERFAALLAVGVKQEAAYSRAGWRADRSNAAKKAAEPRIRERVAELRREEVDRIAARAAERGEMSGADALKSAIKSAAAAGQWASVVSGSKELAALDGSGAALDPLAGRDLERPELVLDRLILADPENVDLLKPLRARLAARWAAFESADGESGGNGAAA
jgi:hypothetical protein